MLKNMSFYKAIYFKNYFQQCVLVKALVINIFNQTVCSILDLAA